MKITNQKVIIYQTDKAFFKQLNDILKKILPPEFDLPNILFSEPQIKELVERTLGNHADYVFDLQAMTNCRPDQLLTFSSSRSLITHWTKDVIHRVNPDYPVPLALIRNNIKLYEGFVVAVWDWDASDTTNIVSNYLAKERDQARRRGKNVSDFEQWILDHIGVWKERYNKGKMRSEAKAGETTHEQE
jgi:hypothetical protein